MASYQQSTFQSSVVSSIYAEKHLHSFEPVMINIRVSPTVNYNNQKLSSIQLKICMQDISALFSKIYTVTVAKSPLNASPRALSDVTYRSHDTRTELTNLSDPDNDQAELDELMSLSSDPKVQRKFLDLRISNKSLLVLNATLESTVKEQTDKIATMPSFEVMMETQQKQSEYLNKRKRNNEKEKAPYDPNSPPLKSLPRVIFYRVAISARQFADKSREKIQGILISN
ncbi:15081_t:CDS:2 [Entrophospora sp. SA101]|nr:15073_t:CDS:2 [Entrophospora sp. SA101]CAJ0872507.1 15081_t:CDS:2 [Entrophospora sp. SA101]